MSLGLIRPRLATARVVSDLLGRLIHTTHTQAGTNARDTRVRLAWATVSEAFSLRKRSSSVASRGKCQP